MAVVPDQRFQLRAGFAVIPMPEGAQLRLGDEEIHILRGNRPELLVELLNMLRQSHNRADAVHHFGSEHAEWIGVAFDQLASAGLLREINTLDGSDRVDDVSRYLSRFGPHVQAPASGTIAAVIGSSELARIVFELMVPNGIETVASSRASDVDTRVATVLVAAWEQPDATFVAESNKWAVEHSMPCLFVDLSHGGYATLGPFFVPREGACHECFRQRWRQNTASLREMDAAHQYMLDSQQSLESPGTLPAFRQWLAGMAVAETLAFTVRHRPLRTLNRAVTLDFEGLRCWSEPAWRIPWCPTCSAEWRDEKLA